MLVWPLWAIKNWRRRRQIDRKILAHYEAGLAFPMALEISAADLLVLDHRRTYFNAYGHPVQYVTPFGRVALRVR